jgi:FSR family fosmidomycin resistance protein-like MFS transporter
MNRGRTLAAGALHFSADLYSLFFPIYMVVAGLDPAWAAMIFAVSSLAANGLQPVMGLWADRVRGKLPVFLGLAVGAVGMSMIGLTRNYALLALLVLVGRLGISLFHPAGSNIAGAAGGGRSGDVRGERAQPLARAAGGVPGVRRLRPDGGAEAAGSRPPEGH